MYFNFSASSQDAKSVGLLSWRTVLRLATLFILVLTIAPYFGKEFWLIDELVNFRFHCVLLTSVLLFCSFLFKLRFGYTFIFIITLFINGFTLMPHFSTADGALAKDINLRCLSMTVSGNSGDYKQNVELVKEQRPDVIFLQNVDARFMKQFLKENSEYRARIHSIKGIKRGVALVSTIPFITKSIMSCGTDRSPLIKCLLMVGGKRVTVFATQSPIAFSKAKTEARNQLLKKIVYQTRNSKNGVVVLGNLNIAPWHRLFEATLSMGKLLDSMNVTGLVSSYPSFLPEFLGFPVDYTLHNQKVAVGSGTVVDVDGSSSRGILTMLFVK